VTQEIEQMQSFLDLILETAGTLREQDLDESAADRLHENVQALVEAAPTSPLASMARVSLGVLYFRIGELGRARAELEDACDGLIRLGQKDFEVLARSLLGAVHWKAGQPQQAISQMETAIDQLEMLLDDVGVEELFAGFSGDRNGLYQVLVEMLIQQGRTKEAFIYSERSRSRAFLRMLGNQRLNPYQGADCRLLEKADWLRREITVRGRQLRALGSGRLQTESIQALESARRRYEALLLKIKLSNPEYASLATVEPVSIQELQSLLGGETTLISYFIVNSGRIMAWVVDRDRLTGVSIPISDDDLKKVRCYAIGQTMPMSKRGAEPLSECGLTVSNTELYLKLVAPLLPHIRHHRLIVVPHGALHYLPFAALRDPESGQYLVERFAITYLPSASTLPFLKQKASPIDGKVLVLGSPDSSLDGAEEEARVVAELFGTTPLVGTAATESEVWKSAGTIDLLHLAAHGYYEPAAPRFSRIALASDRKNDGNLEVHEVFSDLNLHGTNLVVLSACVSGVGERSKGDEIIGLTRAFMYAGSPLVLSTLWSIDDTAASLLVTSFYRRLLDGSTAAEALQHAQVELMRRSENEDPYFWAAFSLHGAADGGWQAPPHLCAYKLEQDDERDALEQP
jgi:CHAT domain-containing protein